MKFTVLIEAEVDTKKFRAVRTLEKDIERTIKDAFNNPSWIKLDEEDLTVTAFKHIKSS